MASLLIVEDDTADLLQAVVLARSLGITGVNAQRSATVARRLLQDGMHRPSELPDAIVLDLDLGYESGFELLRMWLARPRLRSIPMIVWSILEEKRQLCDLFQVSDFVNKADGIEALGDVLRRTLGELPKMAS